MNKKKYESNDLFLADDWLGDALDLQNRLGCITNPYRGNKRKMLSDLAGVLRNNGIDLKGKKVLDLFSGSSVVSYFFKNLGASVWSNDLLAFSYLSSVAFVESPQNYVTEQDLHDIIWTDPGDAGTYMRDNYAGKRFTEEEAERLDIIRRNLEIRYERFGSNLKEIVETIGNPDIEYLAFNFPIAGNVKNKKAYRFAQETIAILHYMVHKCDLGGRLNSGQVIAEVNHRLKRQSMSFHDIKPYNIPFENGLHSSATRMDAIELLQDFETSYSTDFDLVYIDPPYGGDQSDYAQMYEIFEDFLGYSEEHKEEDRKRFAKSKTYSESFEELLGKLPDCPWILSYNDSSWANIDKIKEHIASFGRKAILHKIEYKYQYRSKEKSAGTEYVIVALP